MTTPDHPDETTPLEQPVHPEPTEATASVTTDPVTADPVTAEQSSEHPTADQPVWPPVVPERPSGPHAPAIVLGLVCLAVAGIVLAEELGHLRVDWGNIGPLGIVVVGAILVLFGLAGLMSSRRRSS
ncbi:hypothetical protein BJ986_001986 [Phycicoccus badiiscoriae]|uniref:Uncharacterized protein n=1 Tax=Pedococcus badiiscoriae TaxID=642776 RepID=A0A852WFF5_9MICO|nr:hypothetical protein [Pedococcus badiiscoriae]NYG07499.1 hypothetical protein [Pedococcus badiiscoriae]